MMRTLSCPLSCPACILTALAAYFTSSGEDELQASISGDDDEEEGVQDYVAPDLAPDAFVLQQPARPGPPPQLVCVCVCACV